MSKGRSSVPDADEMEGWVVAAWVFTSEGADPVKFFTGLGWSRNLDKARVLMSKKAADRVMLRKVVRAGPGQKYTLQTIHTLEI